MFFYCAGRNCSSDILIGMSVFPAALSTKMINALHQVDLRYEYHCILPGPRVKVGKANPSCNETQISPETPVGHSRRLDFTV